MKEIDPNQVRTAFQEAYLEQVLDIYSIKNHVYFIESTHDRYVLKVYSSLPILAWQDKMLQQLADKGTKGIVPFIKNKENKAINSIDKTYFYGVMPFIPGQSVDFSRFEHVLDCIKLLGHFHIQGNRIYGKQQIVQNQSQIFLKWQERLLLFKRSLEQAQLGAFQPAEVSEEGLLTMLRTYGQEVIRWATWTLEHFPHVPMLYLEEQAQWERQIAHLDVAPHNFLTLEKKQYYIIDYDLVDYAPALIDVIQYINRVLPYHDWSLELVWELVAAYQQHYPLSAMHINIIPILLIYPHDFIREWLGLWKNQHGYHPQKVYQYFEQLQNDWQKRQRFVQQCMSMIK